MAWIRTIDQESAEGLLASVYKAAVARAGRVFNILKIQSLNPPVLQSSMAQYLSIMYKPSPLSRAQRELIATVVSRANNCHY
ncbi:MAG: carboxymuconolactone decarboxylase family protein [Phycisphaerae bacterium]